MPHSLYRVVSSKSFHMLVVATSSQNSSYPGYCSWFLLLLIPGLPVSSLTSQICNLWNWCYILHSLPLKFLVISVFLLSHGWFGKIGKIIFFLSTMELYFLHNGKIIFSSSKFYTFSVCNRKKTTCVCVCVCVLQWFLCYVPVIQVWIYDIVYMITTLFVSGIGLLEKIGLWRSNIKAAILRENQILVDCGDMC